MKLPFALLGIVWILVIWAFWYGFNHPFTSDTDTAVDIVASTTLDL